MLFPVAPTQIKKAIKLSVHIQIMLQHLSKHTNCCLLLLPYDSYMLQLIIKQNIPQQWNNVHTFFAITGNAAVCV